MFVMSVSNTCDSFSRPNSTLTTSDTSTSEEEPEEETGTIGAPIKKQSSESWSKFRNPDWYEVSVPF